MRHSTIFLRVLGTTCFALATALAMAGSHKPPDTSQESSNLYALGLAPQPATFSVPDGQREINTDLAFQGRIAYQGNYNGFRVLDITSPGNPTLLAQPECNGDQGDLVVWDHILVRSWNTKRPEARMCGGTVVPAGFEGVHIWDIGNPSNPVLVGSVELPCGSHTLTAAGVDDGDLIVYSNNSSAGGCSGGPANGDFMEVIAVPLDDPAAASLIHREPLAGPTTAITPGCSDAAVILGDIKRAACASADTINVWSIDDPRDPDLELSIFEPGVGQAGTNGRWNAAAFTWDGEILVASWLPGGGAAAECEASDPDLDKTIFFYDANTGAKLGEWVLPRPQGADENCSIHNHSVMPTRDGSHILVSGNFQAGTWVVDFSDPANAVAVAWSDPESLGPGPFCGGLCQIGGAWASYWYNGFIYESDITRGLQVYSMGHPARGAGLRVERLNPQTQEFNFFPMGGTPN